jgi:hypothetical protein
MRLFEDLTEHNTHSHLLSHLISHKCLSRTGISRPFTEGETEAQKFHVFFKNIRQNQDMDLGLLSPIKVVSHAFSKFVESPYLMPGSRL